MNGPYAEYFSSKLHQLNSHTEHWAKAQKNGDVVLAAPSQKLMTLRGLQNCVGLSERKVAPKLHMSLHACKNAQR